MVDRNGRIWDIETIKEAFKQYMKKVDLGEIPVFKEEIVEYRYKGFQIGEIHDHSISPLPISHRKIWSIRALDILRKRDQAWLDNNFEYHPRYIIDYKKSIYKIETIDICKKNN